ncbi:DNA polymerase III subunit alpha [Salinisphaera sp. USBA-960]|nr:DNA polymerase III subunit alpha [Salifodinibacter halophilus]NNC26204.1 DNA polymerase III subunit alpha [Salifodinibacter halophilus]
MPDFVHLRVHTEYSLVDGIVRIGDLVDMASTAEVPAIGMADRANVFGLVKFYNAALAAGVKPIIGVDLSVRDHDDEPATRLTVIVQNQTGYANLCRLLTQAYFYGQTEGLACCRREWIVAASDGLIALSGGMAGDVGQALIAGKYEMARAHADFWQQTFGDRYYFEVTRCQRSGEPAWLAATVELGLDLDVPLVATNDVRFPSAEDFDAHEARVCINRGETLADPRRQRDYTREQYLKTSAEMVELFADLPEALANSVEIARRASLELELDRDYLPDFEVPAEHDTASFLRAEAETGLTDRLVHLYPDQASREQHTPAYRERLEHELGVIESMGFPGYFLIVADFIRWAREAGVPVGPGRGSGAGSLVAYALGITDIDPLAFDLLFERFLNPERVSMPDFDVDFCMDGRDRVIEYVAERYGTEKVSQIITYGTMAARAVVRDVGRVLGHPFGRIDRVAKQIPFAVDMTLARALEESEELAETRQNDEEMSYLLDLAQSLEGLSRNPGKHAGGVVIAPSALTDFTPLYCEPDGSARVSQFDKDDVEAVGLVKFDFLGLRTLTIIDHAERSINARGAAGADETLDVRRVSYRDQTTLDALKTGETVAVFQLESAGMRRLIKRLQPDAFEDIVALVALYRPGPLESGMVEDFIDRKHGRTEVVYPHPWLAEILAPTYGVILYQEQVMQIAQVLAGYSLGNADLLRRAMGKKKPAEMAKQRDRFLAGAADNGVDADTAAYIFDLVEKFAGYGFNKSHSAAYALVSYQTAWLKTHYPADFMAATLSADMENTDKIVVLIDECRRLSITVAPPNVNESAFTFSVVEEATIRYGLGAIKGVGRGAIEAITAERERGGAFDGLFDLCRRIDTGKANRRALESLIRAGALDALGPNRASLMHGLSEALAAAEQDQSASAAGQNDMFGLGIAATANASELAAIADWPTDERLRAERDTLGLYLTGHPIKAFESELAAMTHGTIAEQVAAMSRSEESGGRRGNGGRRSAIVAGLVIDVRRMNKGRRVIVSLDDGSGRIECPLFEDKAAAYGDKLAADKLVVIDGTLQYDTFSDGFRLNPNRVMDLAEARAAYASRVLLDVHAEAAPDVDALADCVDRYNNRAGCELVLRYANADAEAVLTFENRRVDVSNGFFDDLDGLIGADSVQVRYGHALDA